MFTPQELADMALWDAEVDKCPCITQADIERSRAFDREVVVERMDHATRRKAEYQKAYYEANREEVAERQKAYYEANREKVAERQKAYREANREKVAERQKAYYEANRDKVAERQKAITNARKARKWTQKELAQRLGVSRSLVSQWENGMVPANWELLFVVLPELREAVS